MHMQVKDGLSGTGTDVEDGAVSLLDIALAGDLRGGEVATANEFGVGGFGFFQSREMFLGNDQDVRGGLRADVFEGKDVFVFVNFSCRNLSPENAAEEAAGIGHCAVTWGKNIPALTKLSALHGCRNASSGRDGLVQANQEDGAFGSFGLVG